MEGTEGEVLFITPSQDIMKILFFAQFQDEVMDLPEGEIKKALEKLGHEVIAIDEYNFDIEKLLSYKDKVDLFLFNRGGTYFSNEQDFFISLQRLSMILDNFTCKKVCWYLDKVWSFANAFLNTILPKVDYVFVNDETWLKAFETDKIFPLHAGAGKKRNGNKMEELESDIVYIGRIYGQREEFVSEMKKRFGRKFKYYDNIWKEDFNNLCKSAKVIVLARFPFDDFFWSDAPYRILSAGGFLIFPRLYGMQAEGFIEGVHYVAYGSSKELVDAIRYWIDDKHKKDRKIICNQGQEFVLDNLTYFKRLKNIFGKLEQKNEI